MKYNIFNPIHKALRAMLYDAALEVQQTNFLDTAEVDAVIEKIEYTLSLFCLHAEHEQDFIHPLLRKYAAEQMPGFVKQHIESEFLGSQVKIAIQEYGRAVIADEKIEMGKDIVTTFEHFLVFNISLFAQEEQVLNKMLWDHYTDHQLMAVEQNIIAAVPADILEFESRWMIRGLNNFEISNWLSGVKQTAPDFVYQSLLAVAEQELPATRFEKLLTALEPSKFNINW